MSKDYRITTDLYTIPYKDDQHLVYAPKIGFLCSGNRAVVDLLAKIKESKPGDFINEEFETLDFFEKNKVLNGSEDPAISISCPEKFTPVTVTLFPTNQCNLRCKYCYASAGEKKPMVMDWHYAVSALDSLVENAKLLNVKQINVGFHGGGEPLFPWALIKRIVMYAEEITKQNDLKLLVYSATNGLLSEQQLEWILEQFSSLNISFDGLPHIQDYHRPLPDGQGSFKYVDRTLKYLDKHNFNYGIRSTISDYNIDQMEESLDFIMNNYKAQTVHFEPVFQCGRCKTNSEYNVNMDKFAENFKKCKEKARKSGVRFIYSGCRVETLSNSFCGVSCDNFAVTPDGYLTPCFETTSLEDTKSETLFFGRINELGKVVIDEEKRKFLHSLIVENVDYCKNCFATRHGVENCKNIFTCGLLLKDSQDTTTGGNTSEILYETASSLESQRSMFSHACNNSREVEYSDRVFNCSNCFGCVMFRHKEYCILNKQYTKEEYEKLIPKIKKHMDEMPYVDKKGRVYKYGEFFPPENSLWAYNESWANQWFPVKKEDVLREGYRWREPMKRDYQTTLKPEDLPDNIKDVSDSILNEVIECAHNEKDCNQQCTMAFRILPYELDFYKSMNLALPRLCFNCRFYERLKMVNPPKLYHRKCMCHGTQSSNKEYKNTTIHHHGDKPCQNEFETAINEKRKEIVYCKECYQAEFI